MYQKIVRHRALLLYFAPSVCGLVVLLLLLLLSGDTTHPLKIALVVGFIALSLGTAIAAVARELRRDSLTLQQEGQEDVEFDEDSGTIEMDGFSAHTCSSSSSGNSDASDDDTRGARQPLTGVQTE